MTWAGYTVGTGDTKNEYKFRVANSLVADDLINIGGVSLH
jgi:hypothetical protein